MTNDLARPDPDELLARVQSEAQQAARGRLKIFLGYVAGVGKTFAMLEAARQRQAEGVDVVIGYVETHGRVETEAMVQGFKVLRRKEITYHGVMLTEMDVDAVKARRPQLALVDELAHTNAPGSRHPKRYQDVEELLAAGIDVYTTLNIQHLESLNDVVAQITGVTVRETIPDRVIDEAGEIELVDLPPDELLQRLKEGKVYVPEQAVRAIQRFFRKGNLTALRELSMRRAAERIEDQMRDYMQVKAIPGPWAAAERLLVCISPNPLGERLVRSARRLADELNAEWLAVYVETPNHAHLSDDERLRVAKTLLLAEELGGRSMTISGRSVAESILAAARKHNVTKIIAGKPLQPRWRELLYGSVVDELIRSSGVIDVFIISSEQKSDAPNPIRARLREPLGGRRYAWAMALVAAASAVSLLIRPYLSPTNLMMIYLLVVAASAYYLGRGPSILASLISVLLFDFFFVPPFLTFAVSDYQYILTFIGLFGVGLVISYLTASLRDQAEVAQRREQETTTLYELSRDLSAAESVEEIVTAVSDNVRQIFGREAVIFVPTANGDNGVKPFGSNPNFDPDENELAVANWAYRTGAQAGRGTDTLTAADARYQPLKTANGVVGVLGVKPNDPADYLTPDQRRLLETFASQAALAIESAHSAERAQTTRLLQSAESLQTALLNSISHDLRTPLVSVKGSLSSLVEGGPAMDAEIRQRLLETALSEADRMNRLVGNLLNMTRLESGAMQIVKLPGDIQDAIGTALENMGERTADRPVSVCVSEDMPLIPMDFVLIVQVIVNLVDNALKYSPSGSPIEIEAVPTNGCVQVRVGDRGVGVPPEDLKQIFDKFYRVQRPENITGTGLGLSISKGIVEAHGGQVWAENRSDGGAWFSFILPLAAEKVRQP